MEHKISFLSSQLMVLTVLDAVLANNSFNEQALEALNNAQAVAANVVDSLIQEHPELEQIAKDKMASFSSSPSKKKRAKKNG